MRKRSLLFLTLAAFLLCGCSEKQNIPKNATTKENIPVQEFFGNTVLTMTDSGRVVWILKTTHMVRQSLGGEAVAQPVQFDYYGGRTEPISHLTAETGKAKGENIDSFYVEGDVQVTSTKGYKLFAENLRWDKNSNQVTTNDRVKFTTKQGDVLKGKGFVSDPDLQNWKILENVQGEFQQFEKRMEDGSL